MPLVVVVDVVVVDVFDVVVVLVQKFSKSLSQDELSERKPTDSPQTTKGSKYRPFDVSSLMRKSPEKSPKRQSQSPSSPELTVGVKSDSLCLHQCQHALLQVGAPSHPPPPPSLHPYLGFYHQLLGGLHFTKKHCNAIVSQQSQVQ